MNMLISTKGRYALRILVDMAEHATETYIPLKEIAQRQEISEKYLESIVKELVKNDVVSGVRGKGGGYRLRRPPEQINVGDILKYMEGTLAPVACLERDASPCARAAVCRTLEFWRGLDKAIRDYTAGYSLADLMRTGQPGDDYII
jgi:Rrf2 family protein